MAHLRLPPELLLMVMKQVEYGEEFPAQQESLRNAMLVNHEWFEAASHILWKNPPVSALADVSPDRRQYYANKIIDLYFESVVEDYEHHATFKDLSFPRLKYITIERVELEKNEKLYLTQYLQPQLNSFDFKGGGTCENLLPTIAASCPALKEITLEEPVNDYSQDYHLKSLKNCKSLETICLGLGWTGRITPGGWS